MSTSMMPVRDETLTLNGLRFHYRDWGSPGAPPLVLLHGGLGNARHWDTLAQSLADRYRVLALDQRGHGESARSPGGQYTPDLIVGDFASFVGELRLSRFPIVGFSFGGHVAYSFAATHPDQVTRLVIVETFVPPATPANIAYLNAGRGLPAVYDDLADAVNRFAQFAPRAPAAELRHWVVSGLQQQADGHWTSRLDPALRQSPPPGSPQRLTQPEEVMWRLLAQVICPTLILRGEATESYPLEVAEQMAAAMPDARVATIPQAGHWAPLDNPSGFARVVRDFLAND
jgi:pimeloyl-ACP methyl ester carboxylesterase